TTLDPGRDLASGPLLAVWVDESAHNSPGGGQAGRRPSGRCRYYWLPRRLPGPPLQVQGMVQDPDGRGLVDDRALLPGRAAGRPELPGGRGGGEPLVD